MRALLFAAIALLLQPAAAQTYPTKPVWLVVPYPPGSSSVDIIGRLVSTKMSEALGQPMIVDNRAGANGTLGSEMVARSPADGYTLLFGTSSSHVISVVTSRNVPFDPLKDFTTITLAGSGLTGMVVSPSLEARSLSDLIEQAKKNPGKLSYASNGIGSIYHLAGEILQLQTGALFTHIPYKGAAQMMPDLISGQVQMAFVSLISVLPQVKSGKVRLIAVLEPARIAALPNVPTLAETLPGFRKPPSWLGFFGPANLPQPLVARLNGEFVRILKSVEVSTRLESDGFLVIANTAQEFALVIQSDLDYTARVVKAAGIKPE